MVSLWSIHILPAYISIFRISSSFSGGGSAPISSFTFRSSRVGPSCFCEHRLVPLFLKLDLCVQLLSSLAVATVVNPTRVHIHFPFTFLLGGIGGACQFAVEYVRAQRRGGVA